MGVELSDIEIITVTNETKVNFVIPFEFRFMVLQAKSSLEVGGTLIYNYILSCDIAVFWMWESWPIVNQDMDAQPQV